MKSKEVGEPVTQTHIDDAKAVIKQWEAAVAIEEQLLNANRSSMKKTILTDEDSSVGKSMSTLGAGIGRTC